MQGQMMDYPLTLPHILERSEKLFSKVEVVSRMPDKSLHRYTYGDFAKRAKKLANALVRLGLREGERVGTLMWNHYAHLEAYFGIPITGGVLHTLNLRLHPSDLAYIINHAGDRFIIIDDVLLPLWEKVAPQVEVEKVIVVPLTGKPVPDGFIDYEQLIAPEPEDFTPPAIGENQALGMCYTSGTTGKPKGVVYSHRAIILHSLVSAMPDALNLSQNDIMVPVVPMFHVNAWGLPFTATMTGTKQVFPGPHLDPVSLLDLYEQEKVTVSAGVPTIWLGILEALEKNPGRWKLTPGLRMVVGGSAAPEALIRAFDRHNLRILHAWGMTETTPLGTASYLKSYMLEWPEDEQYRYRAKQGLPVPLFEIRGWNEAGEIPWDGKTMGELQVRGPWVAASYYDLPEGRDKWTEDGWFKTGDVVTIDPEGYMEIVDRTKDLVKSGGEWISSVQLENALMGHPAVKEAAVIAVPHPKWGERPLAAVVLREGASVTPEELKEYLAPKFAKWWIPEAIVFVEAIPRTSAGKFLKAKLREQFKDWKWEA